MPKPSGSKGSRISAEERQLEQQRDELLRKQQELKVRLERLPAVLAEQEAEQRKRRAAAAGPAISPYVGRNGGKRARTARNRTMRTPRRERWITLLKTYGWLLALAAIIFMLFRVLPTH
jgi:hypothetical protein